MQIRHKKILHQEDIKPKTDFINGATFYTKRAMLISGVWKIKEVAV